MIDIYVCKMTKLFEVFFFGGGGTQILFLVPFLFHFSTVFFLFLPKIIHRTGISSTLYLVNETKYQCTVVIYQAFIFISSNLVSKY